MGAWLGFHDGDKPLMAKLAVHDREKDNYIFVNRKGIKILQLSKEVLLQMMDDGLVDILQTNSTFRDRVTQAQRQTEE
jgi:ribosomal protein S2